MRRRPYGPEAWLIDGIDDPAAWAAALTRRDLDGVVEILPAASTVVVRCRRDRHGSVGQSLDTIDAVAHAFADVDDELVIDVVYDGADLVEVADRSGLSVAEVVERHCAVTYRVAFCGFSPGFGYLRGVDARLDIPRRSTPRRSVPAGSIGLAAGFTCVYPASSPGGWHLLGHTDRLMWRLDRDPPALLRPGRSVRFRQVDA